jgi:hypothetical protein
MEDRLQDGRSEGLRARSSPIPKSGTTVFPVITIGM